MWTAAAIFNDCKGPVLENYMDYGHVYYEMQFCNLFPLT